MHCCIRNSAGQSVTEMLWMLATLCFFITLVIDLDTLIGKRLHTAAGNYCLALRPREASALAPQTSGCRYHRRSAPLPSPLPVLQLRSELDCGDSRQQLTFLAPADESLALLASGYGIGALLAEMTDLKNLAAALPSR